MQLLCFHLTEVSLTDRFIFQKIWIQVRKLHDESWKLSVLVSEPSGVGQAWGSSGEEDGVTEFNKRGCLRAKMYTVHRVVYELFAIVFPVEMAVQEKWGVSEGAT